MSRSVEEFLEFDRENPQVWDLFERFTFELVRAGAKKFGARMVWERMRWETRVRTSDTDYRLNDHWVPHYARKFMAAYPQHDGLFETRSMGPKDDPEAPGMPPESEFDFDDEGQGCLFGVDEPEMVEHPH